MGKNNWKIIITLISIIFFLSGCSGEPADFKGYVLDIDQENNRLLVVSGLGKEELLKINTIDIETLDRLEDAYWISGKNSKKFKKGDHVEVWFGGYIATSFPAQVEAKRIKIIEVTQE